MVHANDNGHAGGEVLSILPMINALRVERYFYIRFLFMWDMPLVFDDIASMVYSGICSLFIQFYFNILFDQLSADQ